MLCKNRFCIYYRKNLCTVNSRLFDVVGRCLVCVWPEFDEYILEGFRAEQSAKLESLQDSKRKYFCEEMHDLYPGGSKLFYRENKRGTE